MTSTQYLNECCIHITLIYFQVIVFNPVYTFDILLEPYLPDLGWKGITVFLYLQGMFDFHFLDMANRFRPKGKLWLKSKSINCLITCNSIMENANKKKKKCVHHKTSHFCGPFRC